MLSLAHIQAIAEQIAADFAPVEKIILFGSYAYGAPRADSDLDLLVLKQVDRRPEDDAVRIRSAIKLPTGCSCDVIVRDPKDAAHRYSCFDPLIRNAFDRGRILYERSRARVA